MKPLAWLLLPPLIFLLGVPLGAALLLAAVVTPAVAQPDPGGCNTAQGDLAFVLPAVEEPRRASLTRPTTPHPQQHPPRLQDANRLRTSVLHHRRDL